MDAKKSSTNSPIGSSHWFNTIMGKHLHIGEFLKDKTPDEETLRIWGAQLYETSKEIIEGIKDQHILNEKMVSDDLPRTEIKLKDICTTFFRYWWNAPGNNTSQGYDKWRKSQLKDKGDEK